MTNPPWLRHLPKGWKASRLKPVVNLRTTRVNSGSSDENYIGLEAIEPWTGRLLKSDIHPSTPDDENENKNVSSSFDPGDVLFGKLRPYLAKGHLAREAGVCTTELLVMTPRKNLDGKFLLNALLTREFIDRVDAETFGTKMPRADWDTIGNLFIPLPPLPEQHAIADYLDQETSKIDALIAEQERLLSLLAEKRRTLITQAVTRGLNPNVPMRNSGVKWLGEIPRHWELKRLKFISPEITVGIVVTPAKYYEDSGVPCLRSLNVKETGLTNTDLVYISPESNELLSKSKVFTGDLVSVRSGQPGTTAIVDERFDGANCIDLIIIRHDPLFDSHFLAYFLNSEAAIVQFSEGSEGAIQQHFNIETAKDLLISLPPLSEQRIIVSMIAAEAAKLGTLKQAAKRAIDLLHDRRAALISAAVTGQIRAGAES